MRKHDSRQKDLAPGRLTGLRLLDLGGTRIGNAGLSHLAGLTGLRLLDLMGTGVTEAAVERLGSTLPGCRVVGP